jgi:hypothetical protein
MPATPAVTTPPNGCAWTDAPNNIANEIARVFSGKHPLALEAVVQDECLFPALLVFSETAVKVPVLSFQSDRYMMFIVSFRDFRRLSSVDVRSNFTP